MTVRHIMIPFLYDNAFFIAFDSALGIAKENGAEVTVVNVTDYPIGLGLDESIVLDMMMEKQNIQEFKEVFADLQEKARSKNVSVDYAILDFQLSAAKSIVDFAAQNKVDLLVICSVRKSGLEGKFRGDLVEDIMTLNPPCNVIVI